MGKRGSQKGKGREQKAARNKNKKVKLSKEPINQAGSRIFLGVSSALKKGKERYDIRKEKKKAEAVMRHRRTDGVEEKKTTKRRKNECKKGGNEERVESRERKGDD